MTRNEAKYAHPDRFQPERFLRVNGELNDDTMGYAYGAGRRICVGRYVADASVWSAMATILAVFKIVPCKDEQGNNVHVKPQWTTGITSYVVHTPFLRKVFLTLGATVCSLVLSLIFFFFLCQAPVPLSVSICTAQPGRIDRGEVVSDVLSVMISFFYL